MEKMNCSVAKDLLPLYIDKATSEETAQLLQLHIETCEGCKADYEMLARELQLPSNQMIQEENKKVFTNFRHKWRVKKIAIACTSVIVTLIAVVICMMIYSHVGVVHDYFSPSTMVALRDIDTSGGWEQISFNGEEYLNFDRLFYKKELVNDANSSDIVELKISDVDRNVVIEKLLIQPGKRVSLSELHKNTDYIVEVKVDASYVLLRFY